MARRNKMGWLGPVATWLLIIGGLVHGGQAFNFYLVDKLPGVIATIVYILVGLSGVYKIFNLKN